MAKKKRQWSNLEGVVPEVAEDELSEREVNIRTAMDQFRETTPAMKELAQEYQALVEEENFADLEARKRSVKFEALERLIRQQLKTVEEVSGQDMWRGEGQTFSPKTTIIPTVRDKEALIAYIKANGMEDTLTLPAPRLKSLVIDMLEAFETMTPAQRVELSRKGITLENPIPGVELYLKPGVHRTES